MMEIIKQALINYLPAFACGFTYIICTFKCIFMIKDLKDETSIGEVRVLLKQVIKDNTDLKNENALVKKVNKDLEDKINELYDFIKGNKEGE